MHEENYDASANAGFEDMPVDGEEAEYDEEEEEQEQDSNRSNTHLLIPYKKRTMKKRKTKETLDHSALADVFDIVDHVENKNRILSSQGSYNEHNANSITLSPTALPEIREPGTTRNSPQRQRNKLSFVG